MGQDEAEAVWRALLTGEHDALRRWFRFARRLPGDPRCKACRTPIGGALGSALRLAGRGPSRKSPKFCNACDRAVTAYPGGAEVELTMLFADVRGSTSLAEGMSPSEFGDLMNRFYRVANRILIDSDAMIDKLVGDEVIGLYLPMIGDDHAGKAFSAARRLLEETGHADPDGPWLPVGAGVHTGTAYVGSVGTGETVNDFTALGDAVNITARLASMASVGEILVSEAAVAAGAAVAGAERRRVELRGRNEPLDVHALRVRADASSASA